MPTISCRVLGLLMSLAPLTTSCCWLKGYTTPAGISAWQDPSPPKLPLHAKAESYQGRIESHHLSPEGLLAYARELAKPAMGSYGNLADGPFHTGIYLSSQAHRYAATGDPAAKAQVLLALKGLRTLMEVTGKRGLLARYFSLARDLPLPAGGHAGLEREQGKKLLIYDDPWVVSGTMPGYAWRADVSKDQYAGFVHGLGTTLALVDDLEIRQQIAQLAAAAVDHLLENHLQIIDVDGSPTTHSKLSGRVACIPIGVNALIALALAKVAAESTRQDRYLQFYEKLIENGYADITYWAHFTVLGVGNRVNDNMAYLALYPLFLLERKKTILGALWEGECRTWRAVQHDRNAFFAFAHAVMERKARALYLHDQDAEGDAAWRGREWLFEFPDEKIAWPVDLTRPGFSFPRAFLNNRKCEPRTTTGVPLYLRPRGSNLWVSDPFRLVGSLTRHGDEEFSGADYLQAYWMAQYHGFVSPQD